MTKGQLATEVLKLIRQEHQTPKAQLAVLEEVKNMIEEARFLRLKELERETKQLTEGFDVLKSNEGEITAVISLPSAEYNKAYYDK